MHFSFLTLSESWPFYLIVIIEVVVGNSSAGECYIEKSSEYFAYHVNFKVDKIFWQEFFLTSVCVCLSDLILREADTVRARASLWTVLSIQKKTEDGFKCKSANSAEPLFGHLWWTELPSVLDHEQMHPPLFVQGGCKGYGHHCIKCTCQPLFTTPTFKTQRQSTIKFNFLQMQCIVSIEVARSLPAWACVIPYTSCM